MEGGGRLGWRLLVSIMIWTRSWSRGLETCSVSCRRSVAARRRESGKGGAALDSSLPRGCTVPSMPNVSVMFLQGSPLSSTVTRLISRPKAHLFFFIRRAEVRLVATRPSLSNGRSVSEGWGGGEVQFPRWQATKIWFALKNVVSSLTHHLSLDSCWIR